MARRKKTAIEPKPKEGISNVQEDPGIIDEINEANIDEIEKKTIDKVVKAIATLESSLAVWDGAKEKPAEMAERFEGYRRLHTALTRWISEILNEQKGGAKPAFEARLQKLREFADICYSTGEG